MQGDMQAVGTGVTQYSRLRIIVALSSVAAMGCSSSDGPPFLSVVSVSIDDESYPPSFEIVVRNKGGEAKIDHVEFERIHITPDDPPIEVFAAKDDTEAIVIPGNATATFSGDIKRRSPPGSIRHRVVNAKIVCRYMDAKVLETPPLVFLLQSREGALEDTLNDDIDPERAKAGLAELEPARGQPSPGYERFVEKLSESAAASDGG